MDEQGDRLLARLSRDCMHKTHRWRPYMIQCWYPRWCSWFRNRWYQEKCTSMLYLRQKTSSVWSTRRDRHWRRVVIRSHCSMFRQCASNYSWEVEDRRFCWRCCQTKIEQPGSRWLKSLTLVGTMPPNLIAQRINVGRCLAERSDWSIMRRRTRDWAEQENGSRILGRTNSAAITSQLDWPPQWQTICHYSLEQYERLSEYLARHRGYPCQSESERPT